MIICRRSDHFLQGSELARERELDAASLAQNLSKIWLALF